MSGQINLDVLVSVCAEDCKLLQAAWWSARGNCMKDAETFYYSERTTLKKKSMHLRVQQTLSYKGAVSIRYGHMSRSIALYCSKNIRPRSTDTAMPSSSSVDTFRKVNDRRKEE